MREELSLTWADVRRRIIDKFDVQFCCNEYVKHHRRIKVWGVPTGGIPIALLIEATFPYIVEATQNVVEADMMVDDIIDT